MPAVRRGLGLGLERLRRMRRRDRGPPRADFRAPRRTIVRSRALNGNWVEHTTIALDGDGEKEIEYEELDRRSTTNWRRVD